MENQNDFKLEALDEMENNLQRLIGLLSTIDERHKESPFVDELFRIFHNIKGNVQVAGFTQLSNLTHSFESLILKLKEGKINFTETFKDTLYSFYYLMFDFGELEVDSNIVFCDKVLLENVRQLMMDQETVANSKYSILIVDDEELIVELIRNRVQEFCECDIKTASNGKDALQLCLENKFHLILTDFKMPQMDGDDFILNLRNKSTHNKQTPVVMITAYRPKLNISKKHWDNVLFMDKPFNFEKLKYYVKISLYMFEKAKFL
ncbi:MAG: response regulator [Bacteriovoracaceae bacterium]